MKNLHLLAILICSTNLLFGQNDSTSYISEESSAQTYEWKGECCDENGKHYVPSVYESFYAVKKFKKKIPIEINFKAIQLGKKVISIDVHYADKISGSTKLINLNDTIAIKLVIGKVVEDENDKYLYKLLVFTKDKVINCWRPLTIVSNFTTVYSQTISLNQYAIGYSDKNNYFQIIEAWVKFD